MRNLVRFITPAAAAMALTWAVPARAQDSPVASEQAQRTGQQSQTATPDEHQGEQTQPAAQPSQQQQQQQEQQEQRQQTQQPQRQQQDSQTPSQQGRESTSPGSQQIAGDALPPAVPANLDNLEEDSERYIGQRVTVTGEIQEVLGPRTFTIDEPNWIDFDGETLIVLPAPLAAMVRDNQAVRVTGVVTRYVEAEIDRDWGWFDDPAIEAELRDRSVIVADTVVTPAGLTVIDYVEARPSTQGGSGAAAGQSPSDQRAGSQTRQPASGASSTSRPATPRQPAAAGQSDATRSGQASGAPISARAADNRTEAPVTDVNTLAQSNDLRMVGRRVNLSQATVSSKAGDGRGFWIGQGQQRLYVFPAEEMTVEVGDRVSIEGSVLRLPRNMQERVGATGEESVYVYARSIQKP